MWPGQPRTESGAELSLDPEEQQPELLWRPVAEVHQHQAQRQREQILGGVQREAGGAAGGDRESGGRGLSLDQELRAAAGPPALDQRPPRLLVSGGDTDVKTTGQCQ